VSDPRIDKVSFTGSVATGKKIMEAAAKTLKRVHLELGGKSVAIFLDTDNLDLIAPQAASPTFFHAGQGCAMTTRVLIPREAHDTLVQKMVDFVQGMVMTRDTAKALALAKRIRTGVVWINNGLNFLDAPFGGFKESGIGREGGRFGMEEYTEMQQIVWKA